MFNVSFPLQDCSMLFNETLMYNLQYGDHTKSQEQVMEAATMAQIPPKLLYNMEMRVGERGSKLSGECDGIQVTQDRDTTQTNYYL